MGPRSTHWGTGIWLLLCTGLAGVIALELSLPLAPQVTAALPAAPLPEFAPDPESFDPPPRRAFTEIAARPLFSESRRPFVPQGGAQEELPDESIAIELVGTLLIKQGRAALLQPQGQSARWVRAGERIAGWQVSAIERDRVGLRSGEEAKTLELRTDLVQPARPPKRAERRRAQGDEDPDDRDQAQDQEQEAGQATGGEIEEAEPRTE